MTQIPFKTKAMLEKETANRLNTQMISRDFSTDRVHQVQIDRCHHFSMVTFIIHVNNEWIRVVRAIEDILMETVCLETA